MGFSVRGVGGFKKVRSCFMIEGLANRPGFALQGIDGLALVA